MLSYLRSNLWSLIPAVAGVILLLLAHTIASASVAISCEEHEAIGANWLICGDNNKAMFLLLAGRLISPDADAMSAPGGQADLANSISKQTLTAAQEGKGRLLWISSAGILLIIAMAATLGSLWLTYDAYAGHARAVAANGADAVKNLFMLAIAIIVVAFLVAGIWQMYLVWLFQLDSFDFLWGWQFISNAANTLPSDGLTKWWMQIPVVTHIQHVAAVWAALAIIGLMALVTSTLHQGPDDARFRRQPAPGSTIDDTLNIAYRRYLGRSFGRLRYGIYLGAALLAVVVAETAARYSWPPSLLDPNTDKDLVAGLNALGQEYAQITGLYLSLLLAVLYYPAITILRNRGREYYRAREPLATLKQQEDWLDGENLSFRFSSNWSEFVALLAPAAAGLLPHLTGLA